MPMPLIFLERTKPRDRQRRGRHFDRAVQALAPTINKFQAEGARDTLALMKRLNDANILAPLDRPFTYGTLYRVLRRMEQLRLGSGPRSVSTAARQRPPAPRRPR